MLLIPLIAGFLIGFVGSMPIAGPIAAAVFKSGIDGNFKRGVRIGFGGGVAEGIYAGLAWWGVGALIAPYPIIKPISLIIGAILLLVIGALMALKTPVRSESDEEVDVDSRGGLATGFLITIVNPTLIATYGTAVAMITAAADVGVGPGEALIFGLATFVGAALWFYIMMRLITHYSARFSTQTIDRIGRGMGVFIIAVGFWFAVSAYKAVGPWMQ